MKPRRKCDNCGGDLRCYCTVPGSDVRKQFYKCNNCGLKLQLGIAVVFCRVKMPGTKVFLDSNTTTTTEVTKSAS